MNKSKWYVGIASTVRTMFKSATDPTQESHGKMYLACIGPFQTRAAAEYMRDCGQGNPHCQCVADAERIVAEQ